MEEAAERPELYDFRLASGVVRDEEGVKDLRGSMEGERDEARVSLASGRGTLDSCWAPSRQLTPLARALGGMTDMRFSLRASVGLTVLAPRPVAWVGWRTGGMAERRLAAAGALEMPRPVMVAALLDCARDVEEALTRGVRAPGPEMRKCSWLALGVRPFWPGG